MMKIYLLIICLFVAFTASAQKNSESITPENLMRLQQYEDTLQWLGDSMVQSSNWDIREQACIKFLKMFVQALKVENSYNYPFDSINAFSIVKEEENNFRIVTWQLTMKDRTYHYYGTIQMNSPALKMYPLIDMSMFIPHEMDTVLNKNSWYGCIYYNIVKKKYKKDTYYLLFGWDGNDMFSNKKICDVLSFNQFGEPVFGKPLFLFENNPDPKSRIVIEYKEDAASVMNYDPDEKKIVISYMRPENPMSEGIYFTYIPDGTYVGFEFKKGYWHYKKIVFTRTLKKAPDFDPHHTGEDPWMYEKPEEDGKK